LLKQFVARGVQKATSGDPDQLESMRSPEERRRGEYSTQSGGTLAPQRSATSATGARHPDRRGRAGSAAACAASSSWLNSHAATDNDCAVAVHHLRLVCPVHVPQHDGHHDVFSRRGIYIHRYISDPRNEHAARRGLSLSRSRWCARRSPCLASSRGKSPTQPASTPFHGQRHFR
jgi:hypothetical protein